MTCQPRQGPLSQGSARPCGVPMGCWHCPCPNRPLPPTRPGDRAPPAVCCTLLPLVPRGSWSTGNAPHSGGFRTVVVAHAAVFCPCAPSGSSPPPPPLSPAFPLLACIPSLPRPSAGPPPACRPLPRHPLDLLPTLCPLSPRLCSQPPSADPSPPPSPHHEQATVPPGG